MTPRRSSWLVTMHIRHTNAVLRLTRRHGFVAIIIGKLDKKCCPEYKSKVISEDWAFHLISYFSDKTNDSWMLLAAQTGLGRNGKWPNNLKANHIPPRAEEPLLLNPCQMQPGSFFKNFWQRAINYNWTRVRDPILALDFNSSLPPARFFFSQTAFFGEKIAANIMKISHFLFPWQPRRREWSLPKNAHTLLLYIKF